LNCNHRLGLHIPLKDTLTHVAQQAHNLNLRFFQTFLTKQKTKKYLVLSAKDKQAFLALRPSFTEIFIHSSYWINPGSSDKAVVYLAKKLLKKELALAHELETRYLVLHAGSAKGHRPTAQDPDGKMAGIATVAKVLNSVLKQESNVTILLENSAHGKKTIGSNLDDFITLKELIQYPERIGFCLDTAHAFSYGYPLEPLADFIKHIDATIGMSNIKLIHFNDTNDTLGSKLDRHAFPGSGKIGKSSLQKILHHPLFNPIPKIIEGPAGSKTISSEFLNDICSW